MSVYTRYNDNPLLNTHINNIQCSLIFNNFDFLLDYDPDHGPVSDGPNLVPVDCNFAYHGSFLDFLLRRSFL